MRSLADLGRAEQFMLYTLVHTALADGSVSPLEAAFVEHVMRALDVIKEERDRVRGMLLGTEYLPELPAAGAIPPYDDRLTIVREALALAAADGELDDAELKLLGGLMKTLEIDQDDMDSAVAAARREAEASR